MAMVMAVVLFSGPAFAQGGVQVGVKAGFGVASLSTDDEVLSDLLPDRRTGGIIGGFVDIPVGNPLALAIEVLYSQKGAKGEELGAEVTIKADYVEIPVLIKVPFNTMSSVRPFVFGGVAPAFNTSAKIKAEFEGEELEEDFDEEVKSSDVGLVFGGGAQFGQVAVEARVNLGMMNINEFEGDEPLRNRQVSFLVSYSFGRR
jgi:Outer membrane protein beta-barrel domain